ncbi:MAG: SDR family oxidoreductase [Pandoraea sp.]|nr:SDR family NAD(P)-dependent oxidoreductase [Pandoraea sp.]MDR3400198.1 SDR family oxidoreductase [Pandoraea sp.]
MNLQLNGKTAVVTGASRGIGLAIVRGLLAEGMQVVGAARTVTDDLKNSGATPVAVDLTSADGPRVLIEQTQAKYGGIDLLVNNLGGGGDNEHPTSFLASTDSQWREMFDLNFFSTVRVTRAALPELMKRRGGIINFSSMCARIPHTGPLPYASSKGAINTFSKGLAEELGPHGVRVNTISPGAVLTEQWSGPDGFGAKLAAARGISLEQLLREIPAEMGATTGQFAEPEHVASLVAYLASPFAAAIHGADYAINGGAIKTA